MDRSKLFANIKTRLLSRRSQLRGSLSGELANIGNDEDEEALGDEAYFGMAVSAAKELELIQDALERFCNGTFGVCESCQCPLPSSRLEALPCALFCIECQREHERSGVLRVDPQLPTHSPEDFAF